MTVNELRQWAVYETLEPFGGIREDWRLGYLLAVIFNAMQGKNKSPISVVDVAPGNVRDWVAVMNGSGKRGVNEVPVHPNVMIFEDIYKANKETP